MNTENRIAVISLTSNGKNLALKIKSYLDADIYVSRKFWEQGLKEINKSFKEFIGDIFYKYDYLIFIMAIGIVVRSISKYIEDKTKDPAVIVLDEKGENVISLLSGHIGGANEMTIKISEYLNSNPVITTATDVNNKGSLDLIAKKINGYIDNFKQNIKYINSLLVENKKVGIYMDEYFDVDTRGFVKVDSINNIKNLDALVYITNKKNIDLEFNNLVKVVPKNLVLSVGCRKNTDFNLLYESLLNFLDKNNIDINSISEIGSVDVKKDEKAIIDLSKKLNIPFKVVSRDEILKIEDKFSKSEFVKKSIGVYSVVEPVAYILSGGNLILNKTKYKGITFGLGRLK
ncbi:cobalt-precorrin 5A hydrolase [Tepidibacter formicigenes]|jgi:cobalt-precorrin 5A hydrolase|uniref:Cobalt-precorrin 5A acetaldehyde-lyase n=1 Tax=Tepidibacter formicigenes DSM 15518 TaxID=1123349 RepID=A0A1M6RHE1_9FIRM|nr:cobalt-precorrin 5A hydrolase [Tepidibacter formicigenes]SHK31844.1 cobalt-precorrin 5A acetaldehyde-lyase [Tepidibacter formicigenes DSM 15518]